MDPFVNVDLLDQSGSGQGEVAALLLQQRRLDTGQMRPFIETDENSPYFGYPCITVFKGGDPKKEASYSTMPITTQAVLRRDEWLALDEVLVTVARARLGGIQDLIDNNLTYNLGNALGTTVLEWHDVSDSMSAIVSMDGVTRGPGDRPKFTSNYIPVPVIHSDFEINLRQLESSRKLGNPLDTTMVEQSTRRVMETLEDMLFTDTEYSFGNGTIYSYLNHPDINTITLTVDWDASAKTGEDIVDEVIAMKQALIEAKQFGPYMIYIPTGYETKLDEDYRANYPKTTRQRIMEIDGIKGVKVIDRLTADNVLMVSMTSTTVQLVRGLPIQVVEWSTEGKWITKYKIVTIQVPRVRSDQDGNSGIVLLA